MNFGLRERLAICALTPVAVVLVSHSASGAEKFFWSVVCLIGVAAFLLVRPSVPIKQRFQMIGLWELMAPVVLVVFATASNPAALEQNATRLAFMVVFFVGVGTAARLLFWRNR